MDAVGGIFLLLLAFSGIQGNEGSIGVNYGTVADNLPPPAQVAKFLLEETIINRVRLFDANPQILSAFAHTGIAVTVTLPDNLIPRLPKSGFAREWVRTFIVPHFPATNIARILVGNEIISSSDRSLISNLVPAMQALHAALVSESLDLRIKVSTPHSLGILASSSPPSSGKFRQGYDTNVIKPLLSFLRETGSPFMVNPYPFFGSSSSTLDYALFRSNPGSFDEVTKHTYTNMLDGQLDAVFSALKLLNFSDLDIVIAETGWPSRGDIGQVGVDPDSAAEFNAKLMQHVNSGLGTPLMPNRTFETYIFALFNEDQKPGPTCERNFGLFHPDMSPVYDIGVLRPSAKANYPSNPGPRASSPAPPSPSYPGPRAFSPPPQFSSGKKQWCLPKSGAEEDALQGNIDYVCGLGLDCTPIQEGGECFLPNTVRAHAAFAMNVYYQASEKDEYDCDFRGTGGITKADPSYGNCRY